VTYPKIVVAAHVLVQPIDEGDALIGLS